MEPKILFLPAKIYCEKTNKWIITEPFQEKNQLYIRSIEQFGGKCIEIDFDTDLESIINEIDGWYIPGGADIDPTHYNQTKIPECCPVKNSNRRFEKEKQIYELLNKKVPILGVCYGLQVMNVLRGGSLIQDIQDAQLHAANASRKIKIDQDTLEYQSLGQSEVVVGCSHHQAIDKIGDGFKVTSRDDDGMIHGMEINDGERWFLGYQYHPERKDNTFKVFEFFINKCKEYKQNK